MKRIQATDPAQPNWRVLVEAIEALARAASLEAVAEIIRSKARQIAGADGITLVLRDGQSCHYVEEDAISPLWKGRKFPMSCCISGWAMLNQRAALIPDVTLDPRIPQDAYRPTFVKSLLMVPVGIDAPVAAIGAYWAERHAASDEELALLESLARATATAIANITLTQSLSQAAQREAAQSLEIGRLEEAESAATAGKRAAEAQLLHIQKLETISTLTGGVAHDFNNLLGVIIGNLDLLAEELEPDAPMRRIVEEALDAGIRGADLVRRLLAFGRRQQVQPRQIEIDGTIRDISQLLGRVLGERILLTMEIGRDLWPVIADPGQLEASIVNLATNARDAMPAGGCLSIRLANRSLDAEGAKAAGTLKPGDYVLIEVADTGCGMPKEVAARIFEPFFTTKWPDAGSGLGLAMVSAFVQQANGRILVDTRLGQGSVFRLYLPRAAKAAAVSAVTRGDKIAVPGKAPASGARTVRARV